MLLLALALSLAPQAVDGLRPGEICVPGTPEGGLGLSEAGRGRVLDGTTGAPLPGARIELWSEGWALPSEPVAVGESQVDGSFRIPHRVVKGIDKHVVRAPGYRSTTVGIGGAGEILLMPESHHLGLRVLDLEGRPIAGARAESRQTCAHGPPAWVGVSDREGSFDLGRFPPLDDEPEIVLSAPGYGAALMQMPEAMLAPGGCEVRLPRRRPIAFVAVDASGKPLAHRRVSLGAEPHWVVQVTDARGRASFDSPFFGRELHLEIEHEGKEADLASGRAPVGFEPRLVFVPFDLDAPREDETGDVAGRLSVVDEEDRMLELLPGVVHAKGSDLEGLAELRPGWGRTTLFAGGPFTGHAEAVLELERPADATLKLSREPRMRILIPKTGYWVVHVQSGDDSITLENPDLPLEQPVPFGGPLVVCAVGQSETRLARLESVEADGTIDLLGPECVVARLPELEPAARWRVSSPGVDLRGHLRLPAGRVDPVLVDGAFTFEAPPDCAFEAHIWAEGRVPRSFAPSLASLGDGANLSIALPRRGSLTVRGNVSALYAGGNWSQPAPGGGFIADDLVPGPLLVDVVCADGRVLAMTLELRDGERREVSVR